MLALRLAKGGWWGGEPGRVLSAPAQEVVLAAQYDDFMVRYENEMVKINRREKE